MRKLVLFAILGLMSLIAFAQVDIKQPGYYQVKIGDSLISQHSQQYQAIEKLLNLQMNGETTAYVLPPAMVVTYDVSTIPINETVCDSVATNYVDVVVFDGKEYKVSEIESLVPKIATDTIVVTECFEDYNKKIWLWDTPDAVWIPFKEIGLSHVAVDSMPDWKKILQNKYRLERTKDHSLATTEYKELAMPFQFMANDSVVSITSTEIRLKLFGSDDWYPMQYVDDQLWLDGTVFVPGYQDFYGYPTRRHSLTFAGLLPNTTYNLRIEGFSRDGLESDIRYFILTTLP